MIRVVLSALACSFALANLAAAQATVGGPAALCYTALSITPAQAFALARPATVAALTRRDVPREQWSRVFRCVRGIAEALVPAVRAQCIAEQDPSELVTSAFGAAAEDCIAESETRPTTIFPLPPTAPPDGAAAKSVAPPKGILP